ncbi:PAS domain-containing protein [Flavobacterium arcticum]|uniref:PAS domain-containing protein n=1 Tax=Flavobacterium arcticum TaxID=1784713 RepID=A0A345H8H0_9FLAO|nr:PAS domain-containing protein [Flavobacterium arcticum]AXG72880.1 PAS domain-containing protein [Flavobacterium arcticum]KAF2510457.1 PAS domain-containing protein [Flavobacterium arcticum]
MQLYNFTFNEESFNKIFPFYILLDNNLVIRSYGKSIQNVYPSLKKDEKLSQFFHSKRPFSESITIEVIADNLNQLVILEYVGNAESLMRGQFEAMDDMYVFVGSPWLTSIEDVKKRNLTIFDFANYDPQLDLLQILKKQEITTHELKDLLAINTAQKEELKKDRVELNRLSLVASANKNAIVFTYPNAEIFWCNDAYLAITGFSKEEIIGKSPIEVGKSDAIDKEALDKMSELFYKGEAFDVEIAHGRKDGTYFWSKTKGQPIYDDDGKLLQYFAVIEDMTKEKEREEQLILLSLIAEKNINAVVICDNDGRIEWVNSSFTKISEYSIEELIGKKPGHLLQGPKTDPETIKYLAMQIQKAEPFNCEIINYTKSGKEYWIKIQGQALYNKFGEISRYFAIEEDITEKKIMETQKEELLASLEKSNNELEDYAQIVSHDLKSPLRSINSLIAWVREDNIDKLSEETEQYLSMIEGKIEKMDHLIQGILTYSKIDTVNMRSESVNTYDIVNSIISIIDIPTHIKVSIQDTLPVINADKYRIQQLFQNLIGNAVNYIDKPEGIVEIGVKEHKDYNTFFVKDNGPGIAKENQEKIFKIFQSLTNSEKSTGIGLCIVKKITEKYNGSIWLESEVGTGTTFYIKIPKQ